LKPETTIATEAVDSADEKVATDVEEELCAALNIQSFWQGNELRLSLFARNMNLAGSP